MYKCVKSDLESLQKRIRAIGRKLDKYGLKWHFEILGESVERIGVYRVDHVNSISYRAAEIPVDVVSYAFEMEPLKLGEWTPVAVIEHLSLVGADETKNMVHALNGAELLPEWWTLKSTCQHCKSNRRRSKTVILQNAQGEYKQVGTTCIKDFTGIDAADIIALYASVADIRETEPRITGEGFPKSPYTETINYLAHCIDEINRKGYIKDETKYTAHEAARESQASPELTEQAQTIIDFFAGLDDDYANSFTNSITVAVTAEHSKISGFVAYAPIAYPETLKSIRERHEREIENAISAWQGEIGSKITTTVDHVKTCSYQTHYGTQLIHLFRDEAGNVYKWKTGKGIESRNSKLTITGTIKEHDEYDGQKQTVLTRCKVS